MQTVHRRGFLRRLGVTAAAGLGLALVPAAASASATSFCCSPTWCSPRNFCPPGHQRFRCTNSCTGETTLECIQRDCSRFCFGGC